MLLSVNVTKSDRASERIEAGRAICLPVEKLSSAFFLGDEELRQAENPTECVYDSQYFLCINLFCDSLVIFARIFQNSNKVMLLLRLVASSPCMLT